MKKYTIFHIPVMSFFSKALYRDVGLHWKGVGFFYLLLLLVICWVPVMVKLHMNFSNIIDQETPAIISQIPEMIISNGEASIEETQPYYIVDPESDKKLIIFDMTGEITSIEDTDAIGLITKNRAIFKKSELETRTFEFKQIDEFWIDQYRISEWLNTIKMLAVPIIYPFAVLGSFVFRIIQSLIYAAIGLFFAYLLRTKLPYDSLLRLAVTAVTPCVLIKTFLSLMNIKIPFVSFLYIIIALGYLFFGVKSAAHKEIPAIRSSRY